MEPRHAPVRRHRWHRWRRWAGVVVLGVVLGLVPTQVWHHVSPRRSSPAPAPVAATSGPQGSALVVLRDWDARRARAWAAGDPEQLADLYVRGSATGRADLSLEHRYLARGLLVLGMRRQVLGAQVQRRSRDRIQLVVTDRLVGAWAVSRGGDGSRTRLPSSPAVTRLVTLRREHGVWRVVEVRRT